MQNMQVKMTPNIDYGKANIQFDAEGEKAK